jgi:hypothetical protein
MPATPITEQQVLEALRQVPPERWNAVLHFLESLKLTAGDRPPIRTGADLLNSDLIGIWADRTDIDDSREFARQLRHKASHRQLRGKSDAAGQ